MKALELKFSIENEQYGRLNNEDNVPGMERKAAPLLFHLGGSFRLAVLPCACHVAVICG